MLAILGAPLASFVPCSATPRACLMGRRPPSLFWSWGAVGLMTSAGLVECLQGMMGAFDRRILGARADLSSRTIARPDQAGRRHEEGTEGVQGKEAEGGLGSGLSGRGVGLVGCRARIGFDLVADKAERAGRREGPRGSTARPAPVERFRHMRRSGRGMAGLKVHRVLAFGVHCWLCGVAPAPWLVVPGAVRGAGGLDFELV